MPQDTTARLGLPLIQPAQAQKHVTHNAALALLDALVQCTLEGLAATEPPATPTEGACWDVGPGATGAWAGATGRLAVFDNGGWLFSDPADGWLAWDKAGGRLLARQGGSWGPAAPPPDLAQLDGVGIGTGWDSVTRLAVAAEATLLTHAGAGHRLTLNKAAAGDTGSLLFQTGWSGRAEIGLAGSNDLSLKVSADGSAWSTALTVARATGRPTLPQGATVEGTVTGTAVMQGSIDQSPGRLMTTGAFGIGTPSGQNPPPVILANAVTPGLFTYYSSDAQSPTPNSGAVLVQRYSSAFVMHRARPLGGWLSYSRYSNDTGATWSAWRADYNQATALGPVSQSAGVPTGALMERGSGANGSYVRFADGTQICTRSGLSAPQVATAEGALFRSADIAWTFPAAFAAAPVVSGAATASDVWVAAHGAGTTAASARLRAAVSRSSATSFSLTAIGTWF